VRLALLEADVNFRVARDFVARVREKAVGRDVLESISPGQHVVKIVHDELVSTLSAGDRKLTPSSKPPTVVMLVGLQGSGKTTTAAKLALHLRRTGQRSLLVAADLRRPAAVEQLATLGGQLGLPVYREELTSNAVKVAKAGVQKGQELGVNWVLVDTGGRLHIDDEMMRELEDVKAAVAPHETLLVVDSMTGQDAVRAAGDFNQRVKLTGLILTKLDGDARGGAALSVTQVTGVPIKFIGVGEKLDALEPFHPDRLASRILGMGDIVTLVEKAQEVVDTKKAKELERKMRKATFGLDDFLEQIQNVRKMGSITQMLEMVPGFSAISKKLPAAALDERQVKRVEAIIQSMTPAERQNPDILNGSRRRRIAAGSGMTTEDVSRLVNQFRQAQKLMKQLSGAKNPAAIRSLFR
jgi:signal recognition particle subunit SRP54